MILLIIMIIIIIIIIIIISILVFKEDNVYSMTASLPYGPLINTDELFIGFICKVMRC